MCIVDWSYQGLVDTDSIMLAPEVSPDVDTIEQHWPHLRASRE